MGRKSNEGGMFFVGTNWWSVDHWSVSGVCFWRVESVFGCKLLGAVFYLEHEHTAISKEVWKTMGKSFVQELLKKRKAEKAETDEGNDEELANVVPHVHELLTRKIQDGKKALEPASLTVFCRKGSFHCCLSHKGLDLKWWGEGSTLKNALNALEASIGKEEGAQANGDGKHAPRAV